mmetsp:Transcript_20778/g.61989  ORF Transcript_20778/g.61989 Transcript_20778/m.61989 type:complete len:204 (+) Transcript_20778:277-888(+)
MPWSHRSVTIVTPPSRGGWPAHSAARSLEAAMLRPEEPPTSRPLEAVARHSSKASKSLTEMARSTYLRGTPSRDMMPVSSPLPAPSMATPPVAASLRSTSASAAAPRSGSSRWATKPANLDFSGSERTTSTSGFCALRCLPTPMIVPPVELAMTKCVTAPPVWAQISAPVASSCASMLSGLPYWFTEKYSSGNASTRRSSCAM